MGRLARPLRVFATIVACATFGFATPSCGVLSSSACAERATCSATEAGSISDADVPDISAEGANPEAKSDAPPVVPADDGANEGGASEDALDGCISTGTEDCTNGIDDNCDGKIDCADPLCQPAFTCVPPVPADWHGPVELWQAMNPAAPPSCLTPYANPLDGQGGFSAAPAVCGCTCDAAGQVCSTSGNFYSQTNCVGGCAAVTPAPDGGCTPVPSNTCGSQGSFLAPGTTLSVGSCAANPSQTVPPVTWAISARVCSYVGLSDSPGGCAGAGDRCLLAPTGDYGGTSCVYSTADPPPSVCPTGYTSRGPTTFYSSYTSDRRCGTCTCSGTPTGGSCSGTIRLYGNSPDVGCSGASAAYTAGGSTCQCYGQTPCGPNDAVPLLNVPGYVQAAYAVIRGACAAPAPTQPIGSATPTGPTTVCCM